MSKTVRSRESGAASQKAEESTLERRAPGPESTAPSTQPLLLEIGCEEIPARFLSQSQKEFGERLAAALAELRLLTDDSQSIETYSTPRRLVARVPNILSNQADRVEETTGPPVKVSYDAAGKPTRAAESFAQKNEVRLEDLIRVTTAKGEYLAARKTVNGRIARDLLAEALPGVITGISFPKSMYWTSKSGPRFSRPIRWLVALLGEDGDAKIIPFEIAGVASGNQTYGHRRDGSEAIEVSGFVDLQKRLRASHVEFDPENRRQMVRNASQVLLEDLDRLVEDPDLETWHVNSSEWPSAIAGKFEAKFLRLPREILITVMRDHQKYFAVEDSSRNLSPRFIAILNRQDDPKGLIRAGHERVLRARFTDAEFFWDTDQKVPLRERLPMLERVTYHEKLGSYADKVKRMRAIAGQICAALEGRGALKPSERPAALRAVELSKCDLTTQMVKEFTELQGVVGGLYAKAQGEPEEVADAVYDHYRPAGLDDTCPRSTAGAIVALADKLDSVIEGFRAGLEPTGSSDPFGLRRAGNGIVRIAAEVLPGIDLQKLIPGPAASEVCRFLRERVEHYLTAKGGFRYDTVRAVSRDSFLSWNIPSDAVRRAQALEKIRDGEDFAALAAAAKRTRNILEKSASSSDLAGAAAVDAALIGEGPEKDLYEAYLGARQRLESFEPNGNYEAEFRALASLRPVVDRFFDKVLVMDEDPKVRANRLRLLAELRAWTFSRLADISEIESTTSTVGAPTKAATSGE